MRSSGTHDTPRSIQMDSHSVQASSAMNHVIWHSRQRKAPHGYGDFVWKDTHCRNWPHIQHRKHILSTDCHRYTCRILDCVEDKGSLLHRLGDCTVHLPLNLRITNYKFTKVHHSPIKCTHNKFHFLSDWQHNRANYCFDKLDLLHSNQVRIHTGFHRFTEIGQSFHNIFLIRKGFLSCKASSKANETGQYPVWMTQKPRKRDLRELS